MYNNTHNTIALKLVIHFNDVKYEQFVFVNFDSES